MDRRTFLKTTTAAAAATSASAGAVRGATRLNDTPSTPASPSTHASGHASGHAIVQSRHEFQISLPPQSTGSLLDAAHQLGRDITLASNGRLIFNFIEQQQTSAETIAAGHSDGAFGLLSHICNSPALSVFSGIPGKAPPAEFLMTWYEAGAAAMFLDECAADFDLAALIAGHSGNTTGLWSDRPIDGLSDFTAANINVPGLGKCVVETLRRTTPPQPDKTHQTLANLIEYTCGPLHSDRLYADAPDHSTASPTAPSTIWYRRGIHNSGHANHLVLAARKWHSLSAGDQLLILSLTRAAAHSDLARARAEMQTIAPAVLNAAAIGLHELPKVVQTAIDDAAHRTIENEIDKASETVRRAWQAQQGFTSLFEADQPTTTGQEFDIS